MNIGWCIHLFGLRITELLYVTLSVKWWNWLGYTGKCIYTCTCMCICVYIIYMYSLLKKSVQYYTTTDTVGTCNEIFKAITQWWTLVELCHEILNVTAIHMVRPCSTDHF